MKDYIEEKYSIEQSPGYKRLRGFVIEAWEALPDTYLMELLHGIQARC